MEPEIDSWIINPSITSRRATSTRYNKAVVAFTKQKLRCPPSAFPAKGAYDIRSVISVVRSNCRLNATAILPPAFYDVSPFP